MFMEEKQKRLDPKQFGIQEPPYTPMSVVEGEGAMFRGIARKDKKRSAWVRIFAIFVSLVVLLPGVVYLVLGISHLVGARETTSFISIIIGLVMTVVGLIGLYVNLKN